MGFTLGAAAITAGTSILGGILGGNAAKKSANLLQNSANGAANDITQAGNLAAGQVTLAGDLNSNNIANTGTDQFTSEQNQLSPYLAAGVEGVTKLSQQNPFSFDPTQIAQNPNYQFLASEGSKAVQQSAAAQGGLFTGGTLKALDQYNQGLATNEIAQAYQQALQTYQTNQGSAMNLANLGVTGENQYQNAASTNLMAQTNAAQLNQNANNLASTIKMGAAQTAGQDRLAGAGAAGSGIVAQSKAWTNALNGVGNAALNAYGAKSMNPSAGDVNAAYNAPAPLPYTPTALPDAPYVPNSFAT